MGAGSAAPPEEHLEPHGLLKNEPDVTRCRTGSEKRDWKYGTEPVGWQQLSAGHEVPLHEKNVLANLLQN